MSEIRCAIGSSPKKLWEESVSRQARRKGEVGKGGRGNPRESETH
jgi:hypothetical protein